MPAVVLAAVVLFIYSFLGGAKKKTEPVTLSAFAFNTFITITPVSYTHLDVYKRQVAELLHQGFESLHFKQQKIAAVSYTHLDVYKRQEQSVTKMLEHYNFRGAESV